jgi:O-antigen/teichoic acid export membrane protein
MIPGQLDIVLLGYFRNPTEVGYYKLAKSISSVVDCLRAPLHSVTYAQLARLWGLGHKDTLRQNLRNLTFWIGLPLGVAVLIGTGLVPLALPFLVGQNYLPAVPATQLLLIASAISLAFFWLRPLYLAKSLVRDLFVVSSSVTVGFALIYPFVIREWGYMGASAWMLALYGVGASVSGSWLWKQSKEKGQHAM